MTDSTGRPVRRVRFVATVCAIVGVGCAVAACDEEDNSSLELTIGDLIPLSGRLQEFGPSTDKAAEIAVDQVDDAIGAVGADHQVTLVTEDDQTSPAAGVAVAQKLVNRGATCLTGSWSPAVTIATARAVSIPEGVLQISPASRRDGVGSLDDDRTSNSFNDLFTATEPTDVGHPRFVARTFDAVVLCYLAAVAAGSVDGRAMADHVRAVSAPPGRRYTWRQLPDAIRALENGKDIDYQGASGPIDIEPRRRRDRLTLVDELSLKRGE